MLDTKTGLKLWFNKIFNTHAVQDGTPPFTYYTDSFEKNDFGLAIRIEEGLASQTTNLELFILLIGGILALLLLIVGITIIKNQRKIRKELRQLRELLDQKEDKPNGEEDIRNN